jgi:L-lactate permease
MGLLKELALSVGLPLAGMVLVVIWKQLLKGRLNVEDRLVLLELLVATLTLTVAIWANDTDARSPSARSAAAIITAVVAIAILPTAAVLVRRAYDSRQADTFTDVQINCANAIGVLVLFVSYLFTHLPI